MSDKMEIPTNEEYKLFAYSLALFNGDEKLGQAHAGFVASRNKDDAKQTATAFGVDKYGDHKVLSIMHVAVSELPHTLTSEPDWKNIVEFSDF